MEESDLAAMPPEAQEFWRNFFAQVDEEIKTCEEGSGPRPFIPSAELREMHSRAINEFGGGIYCPVRQVERLFDFSPVN